MIFYLLVDHTKRDMVYRHPKAIYLGLQLQILIDLAVQQNRKEKLNAKWKTINKNFSKFIER